MRIGLVYRKDFLEVAEVLSDIEARSEWAGAGGFLGDLQAELGWRAQARLEGDPFVTGSERAAWADRIGAEKPSRDGPYEAAGCIMAACYMFELPTPFGPESLTPAPAGDWANLSVWKPSCERVALWPWGLVGLLSRDVERLLLARPIDTSEDDPNELRNMREARGLLTLSLRSERADEELGIGLFDASWARSQSAALRRVRL